MNILNITRYELKILTKKLRTYVILGALFSHFFDSDPLGNVVNTSGYVINETTFFITEFASIWVMFIAADIILKEKSLKMKEILSSKPIKKLDIFSAKFMTTFLTISAMVGLVFVVAWIGEVHIGSSPNILVYVRNYILDVLPMMIFSVSVIILLSMIFQNTKITYVVYLPFCLLSSFLRILPAKVTMLFNTYYSNSFGFSITLQVQILLKTGILLISLLFLILSYVLYCRYFLNERGGS